MLLRSKANAALMGIKSSEGFSTTTEPFEEFSTTKLGKTKLLKRLVTSTTATDNFQVPFAAILVGGWPLIQSNLVN